MKWIVLVLENQDSNARFKRRATAVPNLIQELNSTVARRLKPIKFDTWIIFGTAHELGKLCRTGSAVARHGFKRRATAVPISMRMSW